MSKISLKNRQPNNIFVNISLNDFLTNEEIMDWKKYPQFHNDTEDTWEVSNSPDKYECYEKNELIVKLISACIDKLNSIQEVALAKCLSWTKTQVQINWDYKPDAFAFKNLELMKKNKPNLKVKLGWMEEYSWLNNQQDIYKITNAIKSTTTYSQHKQGLINKIHNSKICGLYNKRPNMSPKKATLSLPGSRKGNEKSVDKSNNIEISNYSSENIFSNLTEDLVNFESYEFNIFKLEEKIGRENVLPTISSYVFVSLGLFSIINYQKFEYFVYDIASGYRRENPYHTDVHAADMVQTWLCFLIYGEWQKKISLNDIDITSLFLAAIVHDYKHPGWTNNYLITTKNEIAIRYNDHSVWENYHISESFKLMSAKPECDILKELSTDDYKLIRKRMIMCVLATDMTLHTTEYEFLQRRWSTYSIKKGENVDKIFENIDNVTKYNIQQEFLNVLIHAADVSNPTKPTEIYKKWAQNVVDEFFWQGDKEREQNMPISFWCDRKTVLLPQSQLGFIDGIVYPLYTVIVEYFPNLKYTISNLNSNIEYFKKLKEEPEKDVSNK